jgi:pyruvate dehydrogenase E1 component alpha subunit
LAIVRCKTYSRSDPATYRPPGELDEWRARDPIGVLGERLVQAGESTEEELAAVPDRVSSRIEEAVERVLASPEPALEEMLRHVSAAGPR